MSFVKIDLSAIVNEGFTSQMWILRKLLYFCFLKNKILIVPEFTLAGIHNRGIALTSNLSEYIDYDNIKINSAPVKLKLSEKGIKEDDIETIFVEQIDVNYQVHYNIFIPQSQYIKSIDSRANYIIYEFLYVRTRQKNRHAATTSFFR